MMGIDAVTRAVDAYIRVASEYLHINIDPVVGRVGLSFIIVLLLGHKLIEILFRKGCGPAEEKLSEGAKSGIYGLFFFSALVIVPLFTYLDVLLGAFAAVVLLLALPFYYGRSIRKRLERGKETKEKDNAKITHPAMEAPAPPRKHEKEEPRESIGGKVTGTFASIAKVFSRGEKVEEKKEAEKNVEKPVERKKPEKDIKKEEEEPPKEPVKAEKPEKKEEKGAKGSPLSALVSIFGKKKETQRRVERKTEPVRVKVEEVTPEAVVTVKEEKIREKRSVIPRRTASIKEIKAKNVPKPVKEEELPEKKVEEEVEPIPEPQEKQEEEVPEEVALFRKVVDELEKKYVLGIEEQPKKEEEKRPVETKKEEELKYNKTVYERIREELKKLLFERERAKLERVTWREVRELRARAEEEANKYSGAIAEEAAKLGDRPSKRDVENAARRILGLPEKEEKQRRPHRREKVAEEKEKKETVEQEAPITEGEEDLTALLGEEGGEEEDLASLLGGEEEGEEEEDLTKLLGE